ncbi:hypothetical protein [Hymenobacter sp.]|uniref:hypothetical protein n=1 Tax=Hymenobacter sp. TaxID=1898978 RepID=UPI00286D02A8|nr:hypothetical protein [Hymenobacter sp.]
MAFNGTEGKPIEQKLAAKWTNNHRKVDPKGGQACFFGRDNLLAILKQKDCQGIRFYYGLHDGEPLLLAVGADTEENDQLGESFLVVNDSVKCPPCSGQANMLNS